MDYCLERKSLDREFVEFDEEMEMMIGLAEMKKQKEDKNEEENNILNIFFK